MHCRNKSLGVLHSLEEAFLDGFQAYILGYADPFKELRTLCCDTKWDRYRDVTGECDKRIDRIQIICQIPCELEENRVYILTSSCNQEVEEAVQEVTKGNCTSESSGEN